MKSIFPCEQVKNCSKQLNNRISGFSSCIKWVSTLLIIPLLFFSLQIFGQAANIDQIRNGSATNPQGNFYSTFNNPEWVNGNAGSSNAHYVEGMSIGYRSLLTGLTNGASYEYIIEYDTKHSAAMAIDYLTHYQRLEPHGPFGHAAEVLNPRIFKSGSFEYLIGASATNAINTFDIPAPGQVAANTPVAGMPLNSFNALPVAERKMTILNGLITDISYVTQQSLTTGSSDATTSVKIRFTAAKDSVVLAWGGHIASRLDWGYTDPPANTKPRSAGGISGSPYHMRHLFMNTYPGLVNISLGNQDRSLSAAAVVPPPICGISPAQTVCVGTAFLTYNYTESATSKTFLWSVIGANTTGAKIDPLTGATGSTVKIVPVGAAFTSGTFDLQLTVTQNGIPITCSMSPAGTVIKVVVTASASPTAIDLSSSKTSQLSTSLTGSSDVNLGNYNYSWTQSPATGGTLSANNIMDPVFTATAIGSYTFTVTATQKAAPSCSNTSSVVVNVTASAPPCAVAGPSPICPGTTNSYIYDPTGDGIADNIPTNYTATWSLENNTNLATPGAVNAAGNTFSVTSSSACNSSYTVRITLSLTGTAITFGCTKVVSVSDITKPFITCPANKNLECGASTDPLNTGTATATDNCTASPTITFSDAPVTANCTGKAGIDRTWLATDACGNTETCVQQIRFVDLVKPVITCPANANLQCDASTAPSNTGTATATDNCTTPVVTYTDAAVAANCTGKAGIDRTWLATDGCGNTATCVQQIRFVDLVKPVITCPANVNLQCGASTNPSNTGSATATDNCTIPVVTYTDAAVAANCTGKEGINRTWLATDGCGNTATCVQQIRFVDLVPPVITNCPADVVIECDASILPANTGTATATDNCGNVTPTYTDVPVTTGCQTIITRTWTVVDGCGNSASCIQHIIKRDRTAPVITCPTTGNATAKDNCSVSITIFFKDAGSIRTWTAIDESGNFSTCSQTISALRSSEPTVISKTASSITTASTTEASVIRNKTTEQTNNAISKMRYENVSAILLEAFPNPYSNSVNFRFVSPKSGKALLEVYDMIGRKMGIVFQGDVEANTLKTVNYKIPELKRVPMVYRLSIGNQNSHGSLLPLKE